MITGIISAMMFVYLSVILYQGVHFDKNERIIIDWPKESPISLSDAGSYATGDFGGFFTDLGSEAGIPGIIIGFILDIFATVIIVFLSLLEFSEHAEATDFHQSLKYWPESQQTRARE